MLSFAPYNLKYVQFETKKCLRYVFYLGHGIFKNDITVELNPADPDNKENSAAVNSLPGDALVNVKGESER